MADHRTPSSGPALGRLLDSLSGWLERHAGRLVVRPETLHHDPRRLSRLEGRITRLLQHRIELEIRLRDATSDDSAADALVPAASGTGPRVALALLVRDDADIVLSNIDFHRAMGVSTVIVTDHASSDHTARVLDEYRQRGLIDYLYEGDTANDVEVYATRMARRARLRHGADWVIHASADEFWFAEGGSLPAIFAALPGDAGVIRPHARFDFIPAEHSRDQVRDARVRTRRSTGRVKIAHRAAADLYVAHARDRLDDARLPQTLDAITVFHYPVRSFAQYTRKQALRQATTMRRPFVPDASGERWWEERTAGAAAVPERYFPDGHVPTAQQIRDGLASGDMVVDERMWAFFSGQETRPTATTPRTPPAGVTAAPTPGR